MGNSTTKTEEEIYERDPGKRSRPQRHQQHGQHDNSNQHAKQTSTHTDTSHTREIRTEVAYIQICSQQRHHSRNTCTGTFTETTPQPQSQSNTHQLRTTSCNGKATNATGRGRGLNIITRSSQMQQNRGSAADHQDRDQRQLAFRWQ